MKLLIGSMMVVGLVATFSPAGAQENRQKSVAVTVYNNNLGVVKDTRTIDIPSGTSQIKIVDVAQNIDPTSVHINFPGTVLEQNYQYDLVSLYKILEKYIDRDIILTGENNETISGTLLSVSGDQLVLKKSDGGLLMLPSISKYRLAVAALPEGLITRPTLVWKVNAPKAGKQDVEVSYQTQGMNWHAEYVAVLNENDTKMDLNSWVSVENNSGATYNDAVLKLVAGDVNMIQPPFNIRAGRTQEKAMSVDVMPEQFQEKEFFEYHIYNLQRPATLANNETKQISLFEASNINVVKKYQYRSGGGYYPMYRQGNVDNSKVAVVVEFENKESNSLGKPIPKGKVRLYKSDGSGIEFIGEDLVDHTPRDEKISLRIGDAFDVVASEVQTDNRRVSEKVQEETYQVTLKNRKKEDVVVEVERYVGLNWEIMKSSVDYEKKNAQTILFKVPVAKGKEVNLTFTVRHNY